MTYLVDANVPVPTVRGRAAPGGRVSELKESLIAIEVFGRKPDYDPKLDSIVRTEAGRLRARLAGYYAGEGSGDPVIIELPKGGYIPVFRQPEAAREEGRFRSGRVWLLVALGVLAAGAAATGWWWVQHRGAPIRIAVLPLENLSHDPFKRLLRRRAHRRDYPQPVGDRGAGSAFPDLILCS